MESIDFGDLPAMLPPPGHTPNYVDPETMHPIVLGIGITSIVLMVIAVLIRVYTKAVIMKDMRVEECQFSFHHRVQWAC